VKFIVKFIVFLYIHRAYHRLPAIGQTRLLLMRYPITYLTGSRATRVRGPLLPSPHQNTYNLSMLQQQPSLQPSNERQIQLALQAIKGDALLLQQRAAAIYNVSRTTLG
jgi:hypothetical protein